MNFDVIRVAKSKGSDYCGFNLIIVLLIITTGCTRPSAGNQSAVPCDLDQIIAPSDLAQVISVNELREIIAPSDLAEIIAPSDLAQIIAPSDIVGKVITENELLEVIGVDRLAGINTFGDLAEIITPTELTQIIAPSDLTNVLSPIDLIDIITPSDLDEIITPSDLNSVISSNELSQLLEACESADGITPADLDEFISPGEYSEFITQSVLEEVFGSLDLGEIITPSDLLQAVAPCDLAEVLGPTALEDAAEQDIGEVDTVPLSGTALRNASCRAGADAAFDVRNFLYEGEIADLVGRLADETWFYVELPNSLGRCWIFAENLQLAGAFAELPVFTSPELPAGDEEGGTEVGDGGGGDSGGGGDGGGGGDTSAPDAPSNLGYVCTASSFEFTLSWNDNSDNEDGFRILKGGSEIGSVGANVTNFVYNPGGSNPASYTIEAYNGNGTASATLGGVGCLP